MTKLTPSTLNDLQRFLAPYRRTDRSLKHGAITDAAKHFGVSTESITRWIKESSGVQTGVWISESEHQTLLDAYDQLKRTEKYIEHAKKELDQCLVLNLMSIRTRKELLGETSGEAFQKELKAALDDEEKGTASTVQQLLSNSEDEMHRIMVSLSHFRTLKPVPTSRS